MTQALGVRYLWIDSLCIVQDDHDDWASEAPKMGHVYQEASLVIVASHARNSTEGLFPDRPELEKERTIIELPHVSRDGVREGVIHARLADIDRRVGGPSAGNPVYEPLWTRAWITQEIILARRKIFYTRGLMLWNCRTVTQNEVGAGGSTGRILKMDSGGLDSWTRLVEVYSAWSLTFQSVIGCYSGPGERDCEAEGRRVHCWALEEGGATRVALDLRRWTELPAGGM